MPRRVHHDRALRPGRHRRVAGAAPSAPAALKWLAAVRREAQGHQLERAQGQRRRCRRRPRSGAAAPPSGRTPRPRRSAWTAATVAATRLPVASCRRTTMSPLPSSATLTASTSTPRPVTVTTGAGSSDRRAVARPLLDDPQRQLEPLGLGDDVGEPGAVREQRQRHGVMAVVGGGVGVLRRPGEAAPRTAPPNSTVAVAPVVEHGDAEVGLGDVDIAVGAHLELGGVPRRRGVRRAAHGAELDAARSPCRRARRAGSASTGGVRRGASRGRSRRRVAATRRAGRSGRPPPTGRTIRRTATMPTSGPAASTSIDSAGPTGADASIVHDSRSQASYCTGWSGASSSSAATAPAGISSRPRAMSMTDVSVPSRAQLTASCPLDIERSVTTTCGARPPGPAGRSDGRERRQPEAGSADERRRAPVGELLRRAVAARRRRSVTTTSARSNVAALATTAPCGASAARRGGDALLEVGARRGRRPPRRRRGPRRSTSRGGCRGTAG